MDGPDLSFLVYVSRSGSTFFGDRLGRHPDVLVAPEARIAPRLVDLFHDRAHPSASEIADHVYQEEKFRAWGLPYDRVRAALEERPVGDWPGALRVVCGAYRAWAKPESKTVVIKKSGWYFRNTQMLLRTFPEAVVLGMVRDPRAIYRSARQALHSEHGRPMARGVISNARRSRQYLKLMGDAYERFPERVRLIKYEDMVMDLVGFLGVGWNALGVEPLGEREVGALVCPQEESTLVSDATRHLHGNVAQAPLPERRTQWRDELGKGKAMMIHAICRKEMRRFGYV